ncbi:TIGR04222 domain-containing membrane protein [Streptomyces sp. NPDC094049]|uniref:TIGR04222 domain-containing membrane protein n=1 Tax=Streptomyces sp. NPDC094049 TaxID=3154987 RepID=UPI00331E09EA
MNTAVTLYYLVAAVGVALVVTGLVRSRRGSGGPVHDRYEAASLNGGPARVADSALAALQADGRLAVGGPGIVSVLRPLAYDPVERAVFQAHAEAPHGALHQLRLAVMRHPAVQEIGDGLAARGLVVAPAVRRSVLRRCAALGLGTFLLFPVAFVLTVLDFATAEEPSFPFVLKVAPALVAAAFTAVVCGSLGAGQVTPAGRRAVSAYGRDHARSGDAGHLVALHGLGALPDPVLRELFVAAARFYGPVGRRGRGGRGRTRSGHASWAGDAAGAAAVWCAGAGACGGGSSGGGGSCSAGACSGGGSGCGGGSGSSCGGSDSSSSCGSSSSSSCGGSSGG